MKLRNNNRAGGPTRKDQEPDERVRGKPIRSSSSDSSDCSASTPPPDDGQDGGRAGPSPAKEVAAPSTRVVYLKDDSLSLCDFSFFVVHHAMKPWRLQPVHDLVTGLGIDEYMTVLKPPTLTLKELSSFHSPSYLKHLCLDNAYCWNWHPSNSSVPFSGDCPPIEGIVEFICGVASASLYGAILLNAKRTQVAINWAGGLHHSKSGECSGFCYVNDIALGIVELLKVHERVLYIDLDVHHGDGVEEAFALNDRVFTLSLHKYGEAFFPGTGSLNDIGLGKGRYYAMNLPIPDGVEDHEYLSIFSYALANVVDAFRPEAVVLQCGADSLAADRVGVFNLSSVGHGRAVQLVWELGLPLLALGGGGYNVRNVAKCWAYETAILCGLPISPLTPIPRTLQTSWLFEPTCTLLVPSEATCPQRAAAVPTMLHQLRCHIFDCCSQVRMKRISGSPSGALGQSGPLCEE
jgi:histone deacetylase 1/2